MGYFDLIQLPQNGLILNMILSFEKVYPIIKTTSVYEDGSEGWVTTQGGGIGLFNREKRLLQPTTA